MPSELGLIQITGPDARDFLNRMSTLDFKKVIPGNAYHGAFLTGKATVITMGFFEEENDNFNYWVEREQVPKALEHFEKFHFAEKITFTDLSAEFALFAVQVPDGVKDKFPKELPLHWKYWNGFPSFWDDSMLSLVWIKVPLAKKVTFLNTLSVLGMAPLSAELFDLIRIQAGIPRAGVELTDKEIILEGNWEAPISRNKGCYPGQEVVERIYTYGQVNKKLRKVIVTWTQDIPTLPLALSDSCRLVSLVPIPGQVGMGVGLAFIHKSQWDNKTEPFTSSDSTTQARLF